MDCVQALSSLHTDDGIASSNSSTAGRSRDQFSQVTVDIKRFGHLMQGQFAPLKAICSKYASAYTHGDKLCR